MTSLQFQCSQCRTILDDSKIELHISAQHLDYFPLECAWCKVENRKHSSVTREDMKKHTLINHNGKHSRYSVLEDDAKEEELKKMAKKCRRFGAPKILSNDSKNALLGDLNVFGGATPTASAAANDVIVIDDDNETARMPNNSLKGNVLEQLPEEQEERIANGESKSLNGRMLPLWCLLDILKCLSRNDLERIQVTNLMLNDIINKDFGIYPLRFMPQTTAYVQVINGELVLSIRKRYCGFLPNVRKWLDVCGNNFFPVNVMRPFLCQNVCFTSMGIFINDWESFTPYTANHIATLESIFHVWNARNVCIYDYSDGVSSSLNLILGSSFTRQCNFYYRDKRKITQITNIANAYSLSAINFSSKRSSFNEEEILQLVQQKTSHPHSDTIFFFRSAPSTINIAMEVIKQIFLTSEDRCRLRLIFKSTFPKAITEFRLQNTRTNELLELKRIFKPEAKENFDMDISCKSALLLERRTA